MDAGLYNLVQRLAGDRAVQRRLAPHFAALRRNALVLDIGGGTGLSNKQLNGARYICLDPDSQKLTHFQATQSRSSAVVGDGAHSPIASRTVDAVLCAKVIHHLDARAFALVLAEMDRVLKPGGLVVLVDAVHSPRWVPRLMWRYDNGSYPRTDRDLCSPFGRTFKVLATERFRAGIFHDFVILAGTSKHGHN